jgi:hypothetical protein
VREAALIVSRCSESAAVGAVRGTADRDLGRAGPAALAVDGAGPGGADQDGVEVELDKSGNLLGDAGDLLEHRHERLAICFGRAPVAVKQRAARSESTMASAAPGSSGGTANARSCSRSVMTPPRPTITTGPNSGSAASPTIASTPGGAIGWITAPPIRAFPVLATQISAATGWSRTAITLAAGLASAGLYYPPAFAALTAWYGPRRVAALTTLTLAAGFASTIFAPLTSALAGSLGWRGTYLVLAAVLAAVTAR